MWEITGAEFTNQGVHTADGISIRFPRVTRIRRDKDWSTATTLNELRELFRKKPESVDYNLLLGASDIKNVRVKKKPLDSPETSPTRRTIDRFDDEPSTSFAVDKCKIKQEPPDVPEEESFEGQKRDNRNESSDSISSVRSERKRLKLERDIKKETEDPSLATVGTDKKRKNKDGEKDGEEWREKSDLVAWKVEKQEPEDRYVNQLAEGMDAEESCSAETSVFDSDAEGDVSNDVYRYMGRLDLLKPTTPMHLLQRLRHSFQGRNVLVLKDVRASLAPDFHGNGDKEARKLLRTYPLFLVVTLRADNSRPAVLELRTQIALSPRSRHFIKSPTVLRRSRIRAITS